MTGCFIGLKGSAAAVKPYFLFQAKDIFRRLGLWLKDRDEMAASRRNIIYDNFCVNVSTQLMAGNFTTGLLLLLNADDAFIGLVTIIAYVGQLFQIFSPLILERFPKRKKLLIGCRIAMYFINIIVIGLIPYLDFTNKIRLLFLIISMLMLNLTSALAGPGFAIWHMKNAPENVRTQFFSVLTVGNTVLTYIALIGASVIADWFKASGQALTGLSLLRVLALVLAAIDIMFLFRIKEHPNDQDQEGTKLKNMLLVPLREKKYRLSVLAACIYSFAMNVPGPYFNIYLLRDLGVSYSFINIFNTINIPILIFLTPVWARIIRRTSWFSAAAWSIGFYLINMIGMSFVTQKTLYLFPVSLIFSFLFLPGLNLSMANIPFLNLPKKNQTVFFGFYAMAANLAALLGVVLGREFISLSANWKIRLLGVDMQNKQMIMLLAAAFLIITTLVIALISRKVDEPQNTAAGQGEKPLLAETAEADSASLST
jgi:MFS family permease